MARRTYLIPEHREMRRVVLAGKILFMGAFLFVAGAFSAAVVAIHRLD